MARGEQVDVVLLELARVAALPGGSPLGGPFFDAHQIDWDEVKDRRSAYSAAEIQSVGRTASVAAHPHHPGGCGCHA